MNLVFISNSSSDLNPHAITTVNCNYPTQLSFLISVSNIGSVEHSLNKSLSLELETPAAYITEDSLGKIYLKVF